MQKAVISETTILLCLGISLLVAACSNATKEEPVKKIEQAESVTDTTLSGSGVKSDDYEANWPGSPFRDFILPGYSLLDSASGDLNLDTLPDMVLVLKKNG